MNRNFQFQNYDNSVTARESYFTSQGYIFPRFNLSLHPETFQQFLEEITIPEKTLNLRKFSSTIYVWCGDVVLDINTRYKTCDLWGRTPEAIGDFVQLYEQYFKQLTHRTILVDYYYEKGGEVRVRVVSMDLDKLHTTYPGLYPTIDIAKLGKEFSEADDSILILQGKPGVGKTTFLKYMLDTHVYDRTAYVKDMRVMMSSQFWSSIAGTEYGVLIFDDLDFALAPRSEGGNDSFVSNLLSYSDGIFGQRSKIIITTNQPIDQMDEALIRPGRCFDFLVLEPLAYEDARHAWVTDLGRPVSEFEEHFVEGDINQADLMSLYRRLTAGATRDYIKRGPKYKTLREKLEKSGVRLGIHRTSAFR